MTQSNYFRLTYLVQTHPTLHWFQLGIGFKLTIKVLVTAQASYGVKFVNLPTLSGVLYFRD